MSRATLIFFKIFLAYLSFKNTLKEFKYINLIFYAFALSGAYLMKHFFCEVQADDLKFILSPTTEVVKWITGSKFVFISNRGYVLEGSQVIINKTCSGINFLIIAFTTTVFTAVALFRRPLTKMSVFLIAIPVSFGWTILANAFRITGAIYLLRLGKHSEFLASPLAHHLQGIIFYFTFLLLYYFSIRYLLNIHKGQDKLKRDRHDIIKRYYLAR